MSDSAIMLIHWSEEDHAFLVTLPEWEGCLQNWRTATHGDTYEEAVRNGLEVRAMCREENRERQGVRFTVSSGNVYADLGIDSWETYDGHTIVFSRGPTSWGAYVEDLPVCVAVAETREECERLIREALALHVAALRGEKEQT